MDIPKDVQVKKYKPVFPGSIHLPGLPVVPKAKDAELLKVLQLLENAQKPVLYTGGGILSGNAHEDVRKFADLTGVPVASTLMVPNGAMDPDHPQSLYWFGMHGMVVGNWWFATAIF